MRFFLFTKMECIFRWVMLKFWCTCLTTSFWIYRQGDLIALPIVISKRPDSYMSEEALSKATFLDNGKPLFRTRLRLVSTIYPEDPALTRFFKLYHRTDCEKEIVQSLDG